MSICHNRFSDNVSTFCGDYIFLFRVFFCRAIGVFNGGNRVHPARASYTFKASRFESLGNVKVYRPQTFFPLLIFPQTLFILFPKGCFQFEYQQSKKKSHKKDQIELYSSSRKAGKKEQKVGNKACKISNKIATNSVERKTIIINIFPFLSILLCKRKEEKETNQTKSTFYLMHSFKKTDSLIANEKGGTRKQVWTWICAHFFLPNFTR